MICKISGGEYYTTAVRKLPKSDMLFEDMLDPGITHCFHSDRYGANMRRAPQLVNSTDYWLDQAIHGMFNISVVLSR